MILWFCRCVVLWFYSFAALFYQGLRQLLNVYRNNITPVLSKIYFHKNKLILNRIIIRNKHTVNKYFTIIAILSMIVYPFVLFLLNENSNISLSVIVYFVLAIGLIFSSGTSVFYLLFNQLNRPLLHSKFFLMVIVSNVIFNVVLIPYTGVIGAAIGTSISNILAVFIFKRICNKEFLLNI